jgi:hypothetical protein
MKNIFLPLLFLIYSFPIFGESAPAKFNVKEKSLISSIKFPQTKGDISIIINCSGVILKNNKIKFFNCYKNQPGDEVYIQEIYKAHKKARFQPAVFNNKKEDAFVQFRIKFEKKNDNELISIINNIGYEENVIAYGLNHIGAQRIVGKETWQKLCPKYNRYNIITKTHINNLGQASNSSISSSKGIPVNKKCINSIVDTLNSSIYIPAFVNGNYVPSTYVEVFGN